MTKRKQPFFRKIIVAWYDSEITCVIVLLFSLAIISFGISGLSVALVHEKYTSYCWVPGLLIFLSGYLFLSSIVQLIKLFTDH